MSEANDPRPALSPALFWRIVVGGNLTTLAVLMFLFHRMVPTAVMPSMSWLIFIGGVVLVIPAVLYRRHAERKLQAQQGLSDNARQLQQLNQVVIGCGLAELPGLAGTVYYLFARDVWGTVPLLAAAVILLLQARPRP